MMLKEYGLYGDNDAICGNINGMYGGNDVICGDINGTYGDNDVICSDINGTYGDNDAICGDINGTYADDDVGHADADAGEHGLMQELQRCAPINTDAGSLGTTWRPACGVLLSGNPKRRIAQTR